LDKTNVQENNADNVGTTISVPMSANNPGPKNNNNNSSSIIAIWAIDGNNSPGSS